MLFIGLMSGTSTDGVDAVLCRISQTDSVNVLGHCALAMPKALRQDILSLNTAGANELHRAALVANELAQLYAQSCQQLLQRTGYAASAITAIGVHGQTVRHAPQLGYTTQLNNPALLAELTGIHVIADFRSRDVAAGGQGAPLAPIFHQAIFSHAEHTRVVLNLGGIANISILRSQQPPQGFDTGPANALLDEWMQQHHNLAYDANGDWAASGYVINALLQELLTEPWLQLPPPKSTGRDLFNSAWLQPYVAPYYTHTTNAADIQATLAAFTARTVAQAVNDYAADATEIIVCGGGAYNRYVLQRLATDTKKLVRRSDELGIGPQQVEAAAFAWLAYAYWHDIPAGQPSITGARHPSILGAWFKS